MGSLFYSIGLLLSLSLLVVGYMFRHRVFALLTFLSEKPNPVLQLVYLTLVFGIFHVFRQHGFHLISEFHHVGTWCLVLLASSLFVGLCFSDPVFLTVHNERALSALAPAPDGLLYTLEPKRCTTCNGGRLLRPARAKHCAVCGHCVHVFDHHCYWANTCISKNNKALFLSFLLATAALCFYCVYLCVTIVLKLARKQAIAVDGVKDFLIVFMLRGGVFRNMAIITLVAGVAVGAFFLFHLRLACKNMTTNELRNESAERTIAI